MSKGKYNMGPARPVQKPFAVTGPSGSSSSSLGGMSIGSGGSVGEQSDTLGQTLMAMGVDDATATIRAEARKVDANAFRTRQGRRHSMPAIPAIKSHFFDQGQLDIDNYRLSLQQLASAKRVEREREARQAATADPEDAAPVSISTGNRRKVIAYVSVACCFFLLTSILLSILAAMGVFQGSQDNSSSSN